MLELPFGEQDRCGLFTLLENDTVRFHIAKDRRDGMVRATQIAVLDQSFLQSNEHREKVRTLPPGDMTSVCLPVVAGHRD